MMWLLCGNEKSQRFPFPTSRSICSQIVYIYSATWILAVVGPHSGTGSNAVCYMSFFCFSWLYFTSGWRSWSSCIIRLKAHLISFLKRSYINEILQLHLTGEHNSWKSFWMMKFSIADLCPDGKKDGLQQPNKLPHQSDSLGFLVPPKNATRCLGQAAKLRVFFLGDNFTQVNLYKDQRTNGSAQQIFMDGKKYHVRCFILWHLVGPLGPCWA